MNFEQFTYWLQGFAETNGGKMPNVHQWYMVIQRLQSVFGETTKQEDKS
jgi:hypothetical protein